MDGDNYTEEQKESMNIDDEHPEEISLEWRKKQKMLNKPNVLEVSYFHDSTNVIPDQKPPKTSYLEKIKTRVRANFKSSSPDKDCGTFTSITTSGVLAKRSVLNSAPAAGRRKLSLSKSQIDSSEYISRGERGLTDHQKSEYRLNVFTNQTDSQLLSSLESDVASLKTAQTKNDWIQEWARNARARSVATTDMSCSYTNDYDYSSSDPNLAKLMSPRPPKSPTKIPSPMHTTRYANRTRASLQNLIGELSDSEDPNMYLEKTKMLINNLQENLSRRNSLKSANTSPKKSAHTTPGISLEHKRNLSLDYHIPSRNREYF